MLGFRDYHTYYNDQAWTGTGPHPDHETYFWLRFCELLTAGNYEGDESRWEGENICDEYGVRCYMEAAWEYASGLLGDVGSPHSGDWPVASKYHEEFREEVAAVDEAGQYILVNSTQGDLIIRRKI